MSADTLQMSSNSLPMPQGRCGCCHHFSVKSQTRAGWITWPSENWSWGFTPDFRSDCSHRVIPEQRITIVVIFWSFRFIFEGCSKAPWERGLDRTTAPDRFQQPEAISHSSPEAAFPTAAIRFGPRVSRQKLQSPCAFRRVHTAAPPSWMQDHFLRGENIGYLPANAAQEGCASFHFLPQPGGFPKTEFNHNVGYSVCVSFSSFSFLFSFHTSSPAFVR